MKLINFLTIALLAALPVAASCSSSMGESASGTQGERTVTVTEPYSGLSSSSGIIVNYKADASPGSSTVCVISGHHDLVDRVNIDVIDGMLCVKIRNKFGVGRPYLRPIVVNISGRPVNKFEASSGSEINVGSALKTTGKFVVDVSSGGAVDLTKKIVCSSFMVDMSSGGSLDAKRIEALGSIEIDGSSGGVFDCSDFTCDALEIDMSSGAVTNLAGTTVSCKVDASAGAVARISRVKVEGQMDVDASSGAIVELGSGNKVSGSSGAIIRHR